MLSPVRALREQPQRRPLWQMRNPDPACIAGLCQTRPKPSDAGALPEAPLLHARPLQASCKSPVLTSCTTCLPDNPGAATNGLAAAAGGGPHWPQAGSAHFGSDAQFKWIPCKGAPLRCSQCRQYNRHSSASTAPQSFNTPAAIATHHHLMDVCARKGSQSRSESVQSAPHPLLDHARGPTWGASSVGSANAAPSPAKAKTRPPGRRAPVTLALLS